MTKRKFGAEMKMEMKMKTDAKFRSKIIKGLTTFGILTILDLLLLLLGIVDNDAILASAQVSKTISISIVPDASRLTNTAYQPNPINIKVGDTIQWINEDSSPHTVTEKNSGSTSSNDESDKDTSSGFVEKIVDEIITNIVVNIRNNLPGSEDIISSSQEGSSPLSDEFDSGIMQTGDTFSYTFNNPGTLEYYCTVHPSMVAEVVLS
jgi:plastocyanin